MISAVSPSTSSGAAIAGSDPEAPNGISHRASKRMTLPFSDNGPAQYVLEPVVTIPHSAICGNYISACWTTLAALFLILAIAIAARKLVEPLLEPLLDWRTMAILVGLVAAHHLWAIWRWRKARREQDAANRFSGREN